MASLIETAALRCLGRLLSPAGRGGRLSILLYHRVLRERDPLFPELPDAAAFRDEMAHLAERFNVLPLGEAIDRLQRDALPARAVCVTFDDGYADNCDVALPVLKRLGLPATFFVTAGCLDGGRMWNDTVIESVRRAPGPTLDLAGAGLGTHDVGSIEARREAVGKLLAAIKYLDPIRRLEAAQAVTSAAGAKLPDDLMMRREQVRRLRREGMEIGGHTITHPILARIDATEAEKEIAGGKAELESILGERIELFAYPNGKPVEDYAAEHVSMARRIGFRAAVTTSWGAGRRTSDPFQLPRFTPWDRTPARFAVRLLLNARRPGVELH
jgi:peptidoglycan/xylan/chitin deacetylase (PgdA/CDA1 family)